MSDTEYIMLAPFVINTDGQSIGYILSDTESLYDREYYKQDFYNLTVTGGIITLTTSSVAVQTRTNYACLLDNQVLCS